MSSERLNGQGGGGGAPLSSDSETGQQRSGMGPSALQAAVGDAGAAPDTHEEADCLPQDDPTPPRETTVPISSPYDQRETPLIITSYSVTESWEVSSEDARVTPEVKKTTEKTIESNSFEFDRGFITHTNINIESVPLNNGSILMNVDDLRTPDSTPQLSPWQSTSLVRGMTGKRSSSELCAAGSASAGLAKRRASGQLTLSGTEAASTSFDDRQRDLFDWSSGSAFHICFRRRLTVEEETELRAAIIENFTRNGIPLSGIVRINPASTTLGSRNRSNSTLAIHLPPPTHPVPTLLNIALQADNEDSFDSTPTRTAISSNSGRWYKTASPSLDSGRAGTSRDASDELEGLFLTVQGSPSRELLGANDMWWRTPSSLSFSIDDDGDIAMPHPLPATAFPFRPAIATCGELALGCRDRHFAARLLSLPGSGYRRMGYESPSDLTQTQDDIWNGSTFSSNSANSSSDVIPLRRCKNLTDIAISSQERIGSLWSSSSSSPVSEGSRSYLAHDLVPDPSAARRASGVRSPECRLCLTAMIPPTQSRLCSCRGALAFAHPECVRAAGCRYCPVCLHDYKLPHQIDGFPFEIKKTGEVILAIFSGHLLLEIFLKVCRALWEVGALPSTRPQLRALDAWGREIMWVMAALAFGLLVRCLLVLGHRF